EANAWQYFWTPAQYNIDGVIQLLGGKKAFTTKLDAFFNTHAPNPNKFLGQEAMIGQYAHGNEPSHHVIYLYAFSNTPLKGQYFINKVINDFHNNTPDGMIGNDDCGQMSAWYVLSTIGFYPVNPASGIFVFGSPQVKKATIRLKNNKVFQINAQGLSLKNIYNRTRLLNGKSIVSNSITYSDIMKGGVLTFNMQEK
ncbi:MAG: glycoside hydrolase domain-containing protein, partial [Chitinophagaceae bacterium]